MNVIAIAGVGIVAAVISVLIRKYNPEYSIAISLCAGAVILLMILFQIRPALTQLGDLVNLSGMPVEYGMILIKSLGICYITQLSCDSCRDAGETALASKIEIAGKAGILILSLPLFEKVIEVAVSLIRN